MNRTHLCLLVLALSIVAGDPAPAQTTPPSASPAAAAVGVVFDDLNHNGRRDADEKGIADVRVSNGREIVKTDSQGQYKLPVTDNTVIFVIKPGGWMTTLSDDNLPRFYYIHAPNGSPKLKYPGVAPTGPLPASVDFALHHSDEPARFKALFFGDTQVTKQEEVDYLAHDIVEELIGADAAFGLTLGDVVGDNPALFESVAQTVGRIGIPWYNVPGNHDENYDSPDDRFALEAFKRVFGPPYYSFEYGPVHFIVMDDVVWLGKVNEAGHDYEAGLGKDQLEFIRNDLALLPKDQLVVLTMHIPLMDVPDLPELSRLLADHPHAFSVSAHYHFMEHRFLGSKDKWEGPEPLHHLVNVTACGSWWLGAKDVLGLPHATMRDGAPKGYSIITFDGNQYSVEFRAARRPAGYQMTIFAPEEIEQQQSAKTEVLVNVFAGSQRSKVEMRLGKDGAWQTLRKTVGPDPYYVAMQQAEEKAQAKDATASGPARGRRIPKVLDCPHLWSGSLPPNPPKGSQVIFVRTTDMFGQTYTGQRIIRIR